MKMRLAVILAAACGWATPAIAGPPLIGVAIEGAPSKELEAALSGGASSATGDSARQAPTCISKSCAADALTAAGADRGVAVAIAITGEFHDQYAITVSMLDKAGRALRRRSQDCLTCTVGEAVTMVGATVHGLLEPLDDDQVAVQLKASRPVELSVDGQVKGAAPWLGSLVAGPHVVTADGVRQEIFVDAGSPTGEFTIALPGDGPRRHHPRRFTPLTLGVAAGGVVLTITGIYLLAIDGEQTCAHPTCPEVRATVGGGVTALGLGVAALGAAGYLYWRDQRRTEPAVIVVPSSDGAAALAVGRF